MNGLHIVADLHGCPASLALMRDAQVLQAVLLPLATRHGLTAVANVFHGFPAAGEGEGGGVTGCVVLAESHVAVHTWPELGMVTLDVHVCNLGQDNSQRAQGLADELIALFEPQHVHRQHVQRGATWLPEALHDDLQLSVRSLRLLLSRRTAWQRLEIHENRRFGRMLRLDGALQTSEGDEFFYHEPLVHTAAAVHPQPRTALVVGGGDGGALRQLLRHPSLQRVVLVEIDREVIEACRSLMPRVSNGAFDDPRVETVEADGAAYLQRTDERYDLVVLDLPDPSGLCDALYGEVSLRACASRLRPGGRLTLHLGSAYADLPRLRRLHGALTSAFAVVRPFRTTVPLYGGEWLMAVCGQDDGGAVSADAVDAALQARGIGDLAYYNGQVHVASFAMPNYLREVFAMDRMPRRPAA